MGEGGREERSGSREGDKGRREEMRLLRKLKIREGR
jgi:hypothetical protein